MVWQIKHADALDGKLVLYCYEFSEDHIRNSVINIELFHKEHNGDETLPCYTTFKVPSINK